MLSPSQIEQYRRTGHLTVPGVFGAEQMRAAKEDLSQWARAFLDTMTDEQRDWYLESTEVSAPALRKLDHPVFHRPVFRKLATDSRLVSMVEQLIGAPVVVFFSQVFMKPPGVGGPKPIHQDNFYFGPDDLDATLTAWVALDEATTENGCLYYTDVHLDEILPHTAPAQQPFNLQIPPESARRLQLHPAPVPEGGISFHHGNTPHQSSANRSPKPRRAAAFHYLRQDAKLVSPALPYDSSLAVPVG